MGLDGMNIFCGLNVIWRKYFDMLGFMWVIDGFSFFGL